MARTTRTTTSATKKRPCISDSLKTSLWLAGAQELEDCGPELRFGERSNVIPALDDLDVAAAQHLSHCRNPLLRMLGFVPAVDEQDRCLALLQLLFGHF